MLTRSTEQPRERLIVALDVPTRADAESIVTELDGLVSFYKIGFQLFIAEGMSLVRDLIARNIRVFLDLKMDDVGETITRAVEEITRNNIQLLTLHGSGATARAAIAGRGESTIPRILSVTLLSSLDARDLSELGVLGPDKRFKTLDDYVLWRAQTAVEAGCDGLIASGETIARIRSKVGDKPIIVSPGIRPSGTTTDDHKRSTTPRAAIEAGADYLVVGRPIRNASDRRAAAASIIGEIEQAIGVGT